MSILDLLYPRRCVECGKLGRYICAKCQLKIEYINKPICPVCERPAIDGITHPKCQTSRGINGLYAAVYYKGPVKKAIHFLKYHFVSDLIPELVKLVFPNKPKTLPKLDCLTPVPLHKKREKERGFNQSLLIAQILGRNWNIPVGNFLIRTKYTKAQADLKRKERLTNTKDVFALINNDEVKGKTIGLIDDVATTSATIRECANALKKAGAKKVWGVVLAHGS